MTATDVAHAGTTSSTHANVAKAKMAMIRCCTTVRPSMPKLVDGRFHINSVVRITSHIDFPVIAMELMVQKKTFQ